MRGLSGLLRGAALGTRRAAALCSDRHAFYPVAAQTRAPDARIVFAEGGGFIPTLCSGGGFSFSPLSRAVRG